MTYQSNQYYSRPIKRPYANNESLYLIKNALKEDKNLKNQIFQDQMRGHTDKPKRPPNPFQLFMNTQRANIIFNNPGMRQAQVMKVAARQWSELQQDKKRMYKVQYEELKKRYWNEMEDFNKISKFSRKKSTKKSRAVPGWVNYHQTPDYDHKLLKLMKPQKNNPQNALKIIRSHNEDHKELNNNDIYGDQLYNQQGKLHYREEAQQINSMAFPVGYDNKTITKKKPNFSFLKLAGRQMQQEGKDGYVQQLQKVYNEEADFFQTNNFRSDIKNQFKDMVRPSFLSKKPNNQEKNKAKLNEILSRDLYNDIFTKNVEIFEEESNKEDHRKTNVKNNKPQSNNKQIQVILADLWEGYQSQSEYVDKNTNIKVEPVPNQYKLQEKPQKNRNFDMFDFQRK